MHIKIFELLFKAFCHKAIILMSMVLYLLLMYTAFVMCIRMYVVLNPFKAFLFPVKKCDNRHTQRLARGHHVKYNMDRASNWFIIKSPLSILRIPTSNCVSMSISTILKFEIVFDLYWSDISIYLVITKTYNTVNSC